MYQISRVSNIKPLWLLRGLPTTLSNSATIQAIMLMVYTVLFVPWSIHTCLHLQLVLATKILGNYSIYKASYKVRHSLLLEELHTSHPAPQLGVDRNFHHRLAVLLDGDHNYHLVLLLLGEVVGAGLQSVR